MTNIYWYIGLSAIGGVVAVFTIYNKRKIYKPSTLIVFFMFSAGVTWIGEFIALGIFNAYAYKTGVFMDPWAQNLLGHLLINTTLYPAASIVMVANSFRYGWMALVAVTFTMIEYVFVHLGLYEQHWWRYYMTVGAVVFFLLVFRHWFPKIKNGCKGSVRGVLFYFTAMLIIHAPAPVLLLMGKQYYQLDFVNRLAGNSVLASIMIIFFYHMLEALLLVICTCALKKWYWKLLPFVFSIAAQSLMAKMNILMVEGGWKLWHTLILYELFIGIYILIEKHTLKPLGRYGV